MEERGANGFVNFNFQNGEFPDFSKKNDRLEFREEKVKNNTKQIMYSRVPQLVFAEGRILPIIPSQGQLKP